MAKREKVVWGVGIMNGPGWAANVRHLEVMVGRYVVCDSGADMAQWVGTSSESYYVERMRKVCDYHKSCGVAEGWERGRYLKPIGCIHEQRLTIRWQSDTDEGRDPFRWYAPDLSMRPYHENVSMLAQLSHKIPMSFETEPAGVLAILRDEFKAYRVTPINSNVWMPDVWDLVRDGVIALREVEVAA